MTIPIHIEFERRIQALANQLEGRLPSDLLKYAVDYAVLHGENPLAIETLCDFLVEYDVAISEEEFAEIFTLEKIMNMPRHEGTYKYLRKLIIK